MVKDSADGRLRRPATVVIRLFSCFGLLGFLSRGFFSGGFFSSRSFFSGRSRGFVGATAGHQAEGGEQGEEELDLHALSRLWLITPF